MTALSAERLIEQIHASPTRIVLAITGGGSGAISELLQVPGASRTMLEAVVPYAADALGQLLGAPPEQFCSATTAREMAMTAYQRARELTAGSSPGDIAKDKLAGVAATAGLASERVKRGPHRAHVAVQTLQFTQTASLELEKGARSRTDEEQLVAHLVLNGVALACDLEARLALDVRPGEQIHSTRTEAEPDWRELLLGRIKATCLGGRPADKPPSSSGVIFPGAFHPLHEGHRRMAEMAQKLLAAQVEFELSIENVDKPPLDYTEIARRAAQFSPQQKLWLTRAATFVEKARVFPAATFVVGADTIERIAEPRYYDDQAACRLAIEVIGQLGCRFLVFGRLAQDGFQTLGDLTLPPELLRICSQVPEEAFRADISSTELRRRKVER